MDRNSSSRKPSGSNGNGHSAEPRRVLITGGAGFIGTNLADDLLTSGHHVVILDNLSRAGVDQNALWLQRRHGANVRILVGDVRDRMDVKRAMEGVEHVFHLAAQVAVTTSLVDPRTDYEVNCGGTLNVLEQIRSMQHPPSLIYTSTNKVYGGLEDVKLRVEAQRYAPVDPAVCERGVDESRSLDFHTPYGCSKGAADQYVLDYARTFDLRTVVFRMSCIYGPHQFGTEDQGWVAHFLIRALENKSITLYGDGLQVRDVLFASDLVKAFLLAWRDIAKLSGSAFNIGGGVGQTISLLELVEIITRMTGDKPALYFDSSRTGDQRYYVSDTASFRNATGWEPSVPVWAGIRHLYDWLLEARRFTGEEIAVS
jgi:CDP-paratose 2-epimerase